MEDNTINLVTPQGELVGVDPSQQEAALAQGYTQATPEDVTAYKYSTPEQQVKAGLEGAAKGATLGISTGIERSLGVKKSAIKAREENNPVTSRVGQLGGFLAASPLIPELGIAKGASLAAQSGRMAVKQALETAIYQGGDEVSKAYLSDPAQSAQSIISNLGMAAVMGGALGALTPPLWKAASEAKLSRILNVLKDKADSSAEAQALKGLGQEAGVDLSPAMAGAMSGPEAGRSAQTLGAADSNAGKAFRGEQQDLFNQLGAQAEQVFGKTAKEAGNLSEYEQGEWVKKQLTSELKSQIDPLSEKFDKISERFKQKTLPDGFKDDLAESLGQLAIREGHSLSKDSVGLKEINRIVKDLPNLHTLEDLRKYQSIARQNIASAQIPGLSKQVGTVLRDAEDGALRSILAEKAPELIGKHQAAREGYKSLMDRLDALNDRLHVGRYHGPSSFISAVKEMTPETLAKRLSSAKDAELLKLISADFPQTAQAVREQLSDSILSKSASKLQDKVHLGDLGRHLDKMSPEMKNFVFGEDGVKRLESLVELARKVPKNGNPSGTASMIDRLTKGHYGGIGAILGLSVGHGPAGFVLGKLAQLAGRELPDQGRLAMLRVLGSDMPASASGFKATVEALNHAHKAEDALNKAAKAVIRGTGDVLPNSLIPSHKDQAFIDHMVQRSQQDPTVFAHDNEDIQHYSPDHQMEAVATMQRASMFLASIRPHNDKHAPFDPKMPLSASQKADYKRQVANIAQPMLILKHLKHGTIIPADINAVRSVYPQLYDKMTQKLMAESIDPKHKNTIPYHTKQGLSLMLGRPLDSSITPQWNPTQSSPSTQPQQSNLGHSRGSKQALNKLPSLDQTASQANEIDKKA